jgi:hypothetical protein
MNAAALMDSRGKTRNARIRANPLLVITIYDYSSLVGFSR